jgi:hypothetical protein
VSLGGGFLKVVMNCLIREEWEDLQMRIGVALATRPTSSSACIIFLILEWIDVLSRSGFCAILMTLCRIRYCII